MRHLRDLAVARTQVHEGTNRSYPQVLSNRDLIGVIAEHAFAESYALSMDMTITPSGDGGYDFRSRKGNSVDIKGTERADGRLMVANPRADIYVLAVVDCAEHTARFVGWTTRAALLAGKVEIHRGVRMYCLRQDQLRALDDNRRD
jgi:hypothetical protein